MTKRFCIFDTEFTTWEGAMVRRWSGPGEHRELIQLAAALVVPGQPWDEAHTLNMLVRPMINPVLSDYAVNLTGITQDKMEREGLATGEALGRFADFSADIRCFSNGDDVDILVETCRLQGLAMPMAVSRFTSLAGPMYAALSERFTFERKEYPSGRVHELAGIPLAAELGQVHDALRDVWSLFVTIEWLERDGARIWDALV